MIFNAGVVNLPPFIVAAAAYGAYHLLVRATTPTVQVATLWVAAILASALFPFLVTHAIASRMAQILTDAPFFRSLRAMGLSRLELRNALLPMLFSAVRPVGARVVMGGVLSTAFVELLFGIPGYGRLGLQALQDADFALMFGWVLTAAGVVLILAEVERWPARTI
jgi:ABC-type dipeptide/oligopeptide/nickel transport system permease component